MSVPRVRREHDLATRDGLAAELADCLRGLLVPNYRDENRPHLPTCRVGLWVDGHLAPDGAPCTVRCTRIRAALAGYDRRVARLPSARRSDGQGRLERPF